MEHFWIVPVIAIAVWILSNLIRPEEPQRRLPRPEQGRDQPPRPASEVDRFLQEINRLRNKSEEEPAEVEEAPCAAPAPPRRVETPRPPRRPVEVVLPRSIPTFAPAPKLPLAAIPVLDVLPVSALVSPPPLPIAKIPRRRASPAVVQLHSLLQSPQSLRAAILLQTVLEPPRCRKRHR